MTLLPTKETIQSCVLVHSALIVDVRVTRRVIAGNLLVFLTGSTNVMVVVVRVRVPEEEAVG